MNLKTGVPPDSNNETCTAGAGSLLVEFGILSRLLGDSTFEWVARRAVKALWNLRSNDTGLLGVVAPSQAIGTVYLRPPFLPSSLGLSPLSTPSVLHHESHKCLLRKTGPLCLLYRFLCGTFCLEGGCNIQWERIMLLLFEGSLLI